MILEKITDIKKHLHPNQRLLGIDWGEKRIGIALSDTERIIASPYKIIETHKATPILMQIIEDQNIGGIIIGLPLDLRGTEKQSAHAVRLFAQKLEKETQTVIALYDERLSSKAVERPLIQEMDLSRKRRKELIDKLAASYMLQGVLDNLKN